MISILIALVVAAAVVWALFWFSGSNYDGLGTASGVLGFLLAIGTGTAAVVYAFAAWSWFAAEHRAQIINREYGTAYTREELFWASDVIDTVRELDRKRVELNGDLMRDADER